MFSRIPRAALAALLLLAVPAIVSAQEALTSLNDAAVRSISRSDGTATVEVDGTYDGQVTFRVFGLTWTDIACTPLAGGDAVSSPTANAEGKWTCPVAGWASFKVEMTTYTSGTANVRIGFGPGGGASSASGAAGDVNTELASAAAPSDDYANPTIPAVFALMGCWDGATWDRCRSSTDATHGSSVITTGPHVMGSAVAHGSNPTAVSAGQAARWVANRAGVPFVIGGHPNVIRRTAEWADVDGAQTNALIVDVSAGTKIVVTAALATCSAANSSSVAVRVGFGTSLPAASTTGTNGIILSQTIAAGSGEGDGDGSGIIATGGDGEDLRYTAGDPAGGACAVKVSYYTIES